MPGVRLLPLLLLETLAIGADLPPRFESKVLPLFKAKCLTCHSSSAKQGGLSLETREDVLRGGKSGAAAVPGKSSDSLLLAMVISGKMPMGGSRISDADIDTVRRWIEGGALQDGAAEAPKIVYERENLRVDSWSQMLRLPW